VTVRVGIDTGGTFTDVCVLDEDDGRLSVKKVPSTTADLSAGIVSGLQSAVELADHVIADVSHFVHGTTVGTNALLTEQGAVTGLITTAGFRDLLELARGRRPKLYDLQADKPTPLVPRDRRFGVDERVRHDGTVEVPLNPAEVRLVAGQLRSQGVEAVAVCLLYSYLRPEHEREIGRILVEALPDVYVSLSSEVLPEFREYERLSTTVTDAYIGPIVSQYLGRLRKQLRDLGVTAVPHVTQSNGGVVPFESAERLASRLVVSGPSTGVVGAAAVAQAAGIGDVITFDMGGTSTDVSLVQDGKPKLSMGTEFDGRPIRGTMVDIHTVGAGGGSIAWVDPGGHLKVGPASAGADPGPACYGRGGDPTVTDANVVLQVLDPEYLLGGQLRIDAAASHAAVGKLAARLDWNVVDTARGIIRIVIANMARAIRVISVQRGYDPRDYVLVPFGGAGPQHAVLLAKDLGIGRVLVPETPGVLAALGQLMTDLRTDFMRTRIVDVDDEAATTFQDVFAGLERLAERSLDEQAVPAGQRVLTRSLEMRYAGQNFELSIPVSPGAFDAEQISQLAERFAMEHERTYGYSLAGEKIQAVTFRMQAVGQVARVSLSERPSGGLDASRALVGSRKVVLPEDGKAVTCPIYERSMLTAGNRIDGPAVVSQMDTTTLLGQGDRLVVDGFRNLVIEVAR
jgi:N-methylhydantoinase A